MDDKIEEYLKILYPEYDLLDEKEKIDFDRDQKFLTENIEEIDKIYNENKSTETDEKSSENNVANESSQNNNSDDESQNDKSKPDSKNNESTENNELNETTEEINDSKNKEILKNIIKQIKIDKYFALLHPEYQNLSEEEKYYALDDKELIKDCFEAIDIYYQDCKVKGTGAQEMEWTDHMIIKTGLELFNKQEKIFTPNDIEQFSNKVKYSEFKQAISDIKEVVKESEVENN